MINSVLVLMALMTQAQVLPKNDPAFQLVFNEEFNTDTLNRYVWMKQYPWGHFTNTNRYPASLSAPGGDGCASLAAPNDAISGIRMNDVDTSTLKIAGGVCDLKIKKENRYGNIYSYPGGVFTPDSLPYKYMRSMLVSRYSFKYGYFEIKFKYSYRANSVTNAFTPTFWLLDIAQAADSSDLMQYSETDIFEIDGTNNRYMCTMHHRTKYQPKRIMEQKVNDVNLVTGGTWHTAAGYWHPHGVDFYLDDTLRGQWVNDTAALMRNQYMVIDMDSPAMNFCVPIDTVNTQYPITMSIDYVKVWQLGSACDTAKSVCNATLATHPPPKVYQQMTEGGTGCSVQLNNGSTGIFGKNYVFLDEGFELGANAEVLIEVKDCYESKVIHAFPKTHRMPFDIHVPMPPSFWTDMIHN